MSLVGHNSLIFMNIQIIYIDVFLETRIHSGRHVYLERPHLGIGKLLLTSFYSPFI